MIIFSSFTDVKVIINGKYYFISKNGALFVNPTVIDSELEERITLKVIICGIHLKPIPSINFNSRKQH